MVTKKIVSLFVMMFVLASIVSATVVQKVYLKNGSVLCGYIQKQSPDGSITIATENAVVCLENSADISNEKAYPLTELGDKWIQWAEENDKVQLIDGKKTLTLADVAVKNGKSVSKVRILERGIVVKYLEQTPNTYTYKWSDVDAVRADRRLKTELSGINRIYELKNGSEYEGEYAEETDSTLSLFLLDGSKMTFNTLDVVKYKFKPINPNQSLFEQSPLIDIVETKNAGTVEGVIIEQNYTSNSNDKNYILVKLSNGGKQNIKISNVKAVSRKKNDAYSPLYDIILKQGEVVVNRQSVASYNVIDKRNEVLILDKYEGSDGEQKTITLTASANGKTKVVLEYNSKSKSNIEQFKLVKVVRMKLKDSIYYGFSYKDLVNSVSSPLSMETSINNTTKVEYSVTGNGTYAFYDAAARKAIPIVIKKK